MRAAGRIQFFIVMGSALALLTVTLALHGQKKRKQPPFQNEAAVAPSSNPFADNNGLIPPPNQYNGPMFKLSHNWPTTTPQPINNPPWVQAINGGQITPGNAAAYVAALKAYVTPNARKLIWDYANWDSEKAGWYNQPWLGPIRESIHGAYTGSTFPASTFPNTGLKKEITTYVLTFYDPRAAYTVGKVWGTDAINPNIITDNTQFAEGAVIVKLAFVSVTAADWPVLQGTAEWPLYVPIPTKAHPAKPAVTNCSFMQFDIIVKDTKSSPKTGWVFSTLVYDVNASGDAWDKMVPLGAMWGNDPDVNSAKDPKATLKENWINPKAPLYSTQTLGWGNRLSGPNDGARNDIMVNGKAMPNAQNSSCMSCHGPAEWQMKSFLLPSYPNPNPPPSFKLCGKQGEYICSPAPGSADWMRWFQSRPGNVPQDAGTIPLDYDMVFAFKSLPGWATATHHPVPLMMRPPHGATEPSTTDVQYNGVPVRRKPAKKAPAKPATKTSPSKPAAKPQN